MPSSAEQKFRRSFDILLTFALRKGVPFGDAQDLVQATIVAALDRFDEGRGAYLAYCTAILANRIKNYWRDRKPTEPIDNIDLTDTDLLDQIEREEERARMKKMIDRISAELTPEESAFLKALGKACEELESRAVSQAARSLGLEPEKGWDIFRRIQRKARALFPGLAEGEIAETHFLRFPGSARPEAAAPAAPSVCQRLPARAMGPALIRSRKSREGRSMLVPPGETLLDLARWAVREESYSHVLGSLTDEQRTRLRSLFS
jgi:DNA-directed RNA polymerase specialized sigma24 family protein